MVIKERPSIAQTAPNPSFPSRAPEETPKFPAVSTDSAIPTQKNQDVTPAEITVVSFPDSEPIEAPPSNGHNNGKGVIDIFAAPKPEVPKSLGSQKSEQTALGINYVPTPSIRKRRSTAIRRGGEPEALEIRRLSEEEEKFLVKQVQDGDTEAFGKLYENYLELVIRHFYYRTGSREIAEDLASRVFITAFNAIKSYAEQDGKTFKSWLNAITHNLLVDYYRANSRPIESIDDKETVLTADTGSDPEKHAERVFDNAMLRQALSRLDKLYREPVIMRHVDGMNYHDIARELKISESNARIKVHRGLLQLRKMLPNGREAISPRPKKTAQSATLREGLTYFDLAGMLGTNVKNATSKVNFGKRSGALTVGNGESYKIQVFKGKEKQAILKYFGLSKD